MVKNKKAFTLVELLAVIVILAVILVIAVPSIMSTITESRKGALASSAKLIASSAETKKVSNDTLGINKTITCEDVSKLNNEDYESCTITFDSNGKAKVTIVGKGKFEGMSVCGATKEDAEISSECATDVACFAYKETEAGISITGYSDTCPKDVIIPGKIDNKTVTSIGDSAFNDYNLTSVTIPDSVTTIGNYVFSHNQLTSVTIPSSVTSIGVSAFNDNELEDEYAYIYKRNSDGSIDNTYVISYGGISKDIVIPSNITTIGHRAFEDNGLTSVTIPNSVTSIDSLAFWDNQLTSVNFPNTPLTIGCSVFDGNPIDDTLEYPSNVTIVCNPPT